MLNNIITHDSPIYKTMFVNEYDDSKAVSSSYLAAFSKDTEKNSKTSY